MKRRRSDVEEHGRSNHRRQRTGYRRNLLDLSDEILLKILCFLTPHQLTVADQVCHRIHHLASDSEVWKTKYYSRWISPRARRIPRNESILPISAAPSSDKLISWLEHGQTLRNNSRFDWKRQFKTRNNWDRGIAEVHEIEVAKPHTPPVLARVHRSLVFTVDVRLGLRVWSQESSPGKLRAQFLLPHAGQPVALAVGGCGRNVNIVIGFNDGHFSFYRLVNNSDLMLLVNYKSDNDAAISSIAVAGSYVLTMSDDRRLSLYRLCSSQGSWTVSKLSTLYTASPPGVASLALRFVSTAVIATVCYSFYQVHAGWCLGLQEITLGTTSGDVESRTASNVDTPLDAQYVGQSKWAIASRSAYSSALESPFALRPEVRSAPMSLSYSHPYLIAGLRDNTIMSYIVTSDNEKLEISSGRRLWGHTSAVSGAEVSNRGKAVSMSARGGEVHLWELEQILTTNGEQIPHRAVLPPYTTMEAGKWEPNNIGVALKEMKQEFPFTRRWIGFDDEQVVILGESEDRRQLMACYDFT